MRLIWKINGIVTLCSVMCGVCLAAHYTLQARHQGWKISSHVPWNSYAGSGLHKLATCAGWHQDYWKMSQVSQPFYCHCCQVGFSMTSQKCNGKTLPMKEWKKLLQTLHWCLVGGLEITTSLKEIPHVLQILVLFVWYKFQAMSPNETLPLETMAVR